VTPLKPLPLILKGSVLARVEKEQEAQHLQRDHVTRYVSKFVLHFTNYGSQKGRGGFRHVRPVRPHRGPHKKGAPTWGQA